MISCVLGEGTGDGDGESDVEASSRYAADRTRLLGSDGVSKKVHIERRNYH